jgi:hypothetical protein
MEMVLLGSKSSQLRAQHIAIPAAPNPLMATALQRWAERAQVRPGEPYLRALVRGGTVRNDRLGATSVSGIVKRAIARHLQRAGYGRTEADQQARRFSSHSGRVGLYVAASEAGVPAQHIAALARHTSMAMALRYTRKADLLRCSPHTRPGVGV